jgi:hypothetical protein
MKMEIAGKMTSGVRGFEEIKAAVVNEANATSTTSRVYEISPDKAQISVHVHGMPVHKETPSA